MEEGKKNTCPRCGYVAPKPKDMKRHLERKKPCEDKKVAPVKGRVVHDVADDDEAWEKLTWEEKMTYFIDWLKENGVDYVRHYKSLAERDDEELNEMERLQLEDYKKSITILQECMDKADKKLEQHEAWKKKKLEVAR